MKWIQYQITGFITSIDEETKEEKKTEVLSWVEVSYSEENLARAMADAYNGEYTIVDDGEPEPAETVTWDELDAAYQEGVDSV